MDMRILIMLLLTSGSVCAQVKIAGHRGGYYHQYPESSFPLFEFIASQFAGDTITIEIDVRTSKDKTLYLMHDETLDRTTTGSGKINDKPDAFLNTLLLKDKNGEETTQRIATLEETLNFIQTRNINLMLDIKEPIHKATLEQVKKHNLENRVLVLTFQKENSRLVAENHPDVLLSALIEILLLVSLRLWVPNAEGVSLPIKKLCLPMGNAMCIIFSASSGVAILPSNVKSLNRVTIANSPPKTDL